MTRKSYLYNPEIRWDRLNAGKRRRLLPYPTHRLKVGDATCLVYEIPEREMQAVLDEINPCYYVHKLNANDWYYDGYKNARFKLKKAMIIRFYGVNHIVSPWFVESGASRFGFVKWEPGLHGWGFPQPIPSNGDF